MSFIQNSILTNSILLKSNLKNKDIFLNSFKIRVFYYIVCKLEVNVHFPPIVLGWILVFNSIFNFICYFSLFSEWKFDICFFLLTWLTIWGVHSFCSLINFIIIIIINLFLARSPLYLKIAGAKWQGPCMWAHFLFFLFFIFYLSLGGLGIIVLK